MKVLRLLVILTIAAGTVVAIGEPAAASVDVADDLHAEYDGCIAKFTAAGLRDLVDQLDKSSHVFKIVKSAGTITNPDWWNSDNAQNGKGTGGTTKWNPSDTSPLPGGHKRDTCATLYHEMSHLADYDKGTNQKHECTYTKDGKKQTAGTTAGEVKATRKENEYRKTQPDLKNDPRTTYNGTDPLPPDGTNCDPPPPPPPSRGCSAGCAIGAGDPHLKTYDGLNYDFQAVGEFILTSSSAGDLEIQGRQQAPSGLRTVSYYTAVAANVAGDRVSVYRRPAGAEVRIGTTVTDLSAGAVTLPKGGGVERFSDGSVDIRWPDGSVLNARPSGGISLSLSIHLAEARKGTVRGLFGNFDGKPEGDLVVRDGATISEPKFENIYPRYADSWRIAAADSLFVYGTGESTGTFTDKSLPEKPVRPADLPNRAAAEAICRQAGVTEGQALEWCILDVGLTGDPAFARDALATQRLTNVAGTTTLTVDRPGGKARLTFPGTAGQRVFIDAVSSDVPDQCGVLTLRDPAGNYLGGGCIINGTGFVDGELLPVTGTYELTFAPSNNTTGKANVRVVPSNDIRINVTPDAAPYTVDIRDFGGEGSLRFAGTPGMKVFVDVSSSTLPDQCGVLTLRDPNGDYLASGCIISGRGIVDGTVLSKTGEYVLTVDPSARGTGTSQIRITLAHDQSGTIVLNGAAVTATIGQPGAAARFTFTGKAGQSVAVDVPTATLPDQCGVLTLRGPGDEFVGSGCVINGKGEIRSEVLPANGTYTVIVDPGERATGTAQVRIHT